MDPHQQPVNTNAGKSRSKEAGVAEPTLPPPDPKPRPGPELARKMLSVEESMAFLKKHGLSVVKYVVCVSKEDLRENTSHLKFPLVMKILSPQIIHKTDVGGIVLGIRDKNSLLSEYDSLMERIKQNAPEAKIEGVLVQESVLGREVLIGMKNDPQFGKIVVVATGGVFVELFNDAVFRAAPVYPEEAKEMISELKGKKLLEGFRGEKAVSINALANLISSFSKMILTREDLLEVDFNPVIVNEKEALVADARLIVDCAKSPSQKKQPCGLDAAHAKTRIVLENLGKRSLDIFFNPKSIAVIGASRDEGSVGFGVVRNLRTGNVFQSGTARPFKGRIYPVNPNADEIDGLKCYHSIKEVPGKVDLAVISIPAKFILQVMKECADKKIRAAIIISAGFAEHGSEGAALQEEVLKLARSARMRIIGPNCLGLIRPSSSLNASFAPAMPKDGGVAFISQSGALVDSVIDWALEEDYGFSSVISLGNMADIGFAELFDWFAKDSKTRVVTLYVEGVHDGPAFMQAAQRLSQKKPVLVVKAGRTSAGSAAVSSHTGSLAGSYSVFKSVMKQCGVTVVGSIDEMFNTAKAVASQPVAKEDGVAIITNAGGPGVLTADYCEEAGMKLAVLGEEVLKKLDSSGKMHPAYSRHNPLDLVGDALPERYSIAVDLLLAEKNVNGLIVIQTLQTMTDSEKDAEALINAHKKYPQKPIVAVFMGGKFTKKGIALLEKNGIPNYDDPSKAAKAMKALLPKRGLKKYVF
ncbi:acetate--CoA ligase family protein [Candidatus Woesearchaeota archaeon]|nr:acetate--CoA ligase family protein [Candidatus Woesearchaeota archaeon]